jgi:hypothetical protein
LVVINKGVAWTDAKNTRSRRVIPLDETTLKAIAFRRRQQIEERMAAGAEWEGEDLITATRTGKAVIPRSLDRALQLMIEKAGVPRL